MTGTLRFASGRCRTMAILFNDDLEALIRLLARAGYRVRTTRKIPGDRGRTADIYLSNGVVICWDASSCRIWIDRFSRRGSHVEKYLRRMCEGSPILRLLAIARARVSASIETVHTALAAWLLRSEGLAARFVRQQITRA